MYDDNFKMEKTHSVHLTPEPSSLTKQTRRLMAHRPLGRVEEDKCTVLQDRFLSSVAFFFFFFFKILFGFVFRYLQCTFLTSDLCIVLSLYEKRKGKKKTRQALPC